MATSFRRRSAPRRPGALLPSTLLVAALVGVACTTPAADPDSPSAGSATPFVSATPIDPPAIVTPRAAPDTDPAVLRQARQKIRKIVFLVKENRTFDTLFGRFPGADGVTEGHT